MSTLVRSPYRTQKPPPGSQLDRAHPLAQGLACCWPMNEGSGMLAHDLVANQDLSFVNGPKWTVDALGPAVSFTRASSHYLAPVGSALQLPIGNTFYTISAWVSFTTYIDSMNIAGWGTSGGANLVNSLKVTTFPTSGFDNYWWSNDLHVASSSQNDGRLHNIVATYLRGSRAIYVDGVFVNSDVANDNHAVPDPPANFRIGGFNNEFWGGNISSVMIWNRSMGGAEIARLYYEPFSMLRGPDAWRGSFVTPTQFIDNSPRLGAKWQRFWGWV